MDVVHEALERAGLHEKVFESLRTTAEAVMLENEKAVMQQNQMLREQEDRDPETFAQSHSYRRQQVRACFCTHRCVCVEAKIL